MLWLSPDLGTSNVVSEKPEVKKFALYTCRVLQRVLQRACRVLQDMQNMFQSNIVLMDKQLKNNEA